MTGYRLGNLEFEWDDAKAMSNAGKHVVTFTEAATAFLHIYAERMPNAKHSQVEERFLLLAASIWEQNISRSSYSARD